MIKITDNDWRPFIELTEATTDAIVYFDVTTVYYIVQNKEDTVITLKNNEILVVKEKAKDIIKAVDGMIKIEADRKTEQARKYMEATAERVNKFERKQ